jgi:hypothetical protein
MDKDQYQTLDAELIKNTSSTYISIGRKQEEWVINDVKVNDQSLIGDISMTKFFSQHEMNQDFHLPVFAAIEFIAQLQIIFMHHWAGMSKKTREVWILESNFKALSPIKQAENIKVEIKIEKIKMIGDKIFCCATNHVTDKTGGHFKVWTKSIMTD